MNTKIITLRFTRQIMAAFAMLALVLTLVPMQAFAAQPEVEKKVMVCKKDNSNELSFTPNNVNISALSGLANSGLNKDIAPPTLPDYPDGINWETLYGGYTGEQIWDNNCNMPTPAPDTATLTLVKSLSTGPSVLSDWTLTATGPEVISGKTGEAAITGAIVLTGTYALSESGSPTNYTPSLWECGNKVVTGGQVELLKNDTVICTITNTWVDSTVYGELTIEKVIVGSDAYNETQFSFIFNTEDPVAFLVNGNTISDVSGSYTVVESGEVNNSVTIGDDTFTVEYSAGCEGTMTTQGATCTITNTWNDPVLGSISGTKYEFGLNVPAGLSGWTIFIDGNDNGTLDNGEVEMKTDIDGNYTFSNLSDGDYVICEEQQTGYTQITIGQTLNTNNCHEVTIQSANDVVDIDFWNERNAVPPVLGCTDPTATNYNPDAADCEYDQVTPPVCTIGGNLLLNGSFEEPVVTGNNNYQGGVWQSLVSIPGWVATNGFELWNNVWGGASHGDQNLELDVAEGTTITQEVTTVIGATYELRFDFSARPERPLTDNKAAAMVNGVDAVLVEADGSNLTATDWTTYAHTFVADTTETEIGFDYRGTNNGHGALLDNAVLCLVSNPVIDTDPEPEPTTPVRRSGGGGGTRVAQTPAPVVAGEATSATPAVLPTPLVLGEQVSAVPYGAPATGHGGTSSTPSSNLSLMQILFGARRFELMI